MPELPEVEIAGRGIRPLVAGNDILRAIVRTPRLRHEFHPQLPQILAGLRVEDVRRRGKYLLLPCSAGGVGSGTLIIHLGMSGSLLWLTPDAAARPPGKHDHFDLVFADGALRLNDPRRFGAVVWHAGTDVEANPLIAPLGIEPFDEGFTGAWLHAAFRARSAPVKTVLMDSHTLVGVGNIYASESLFRAAVSPLRAARRIAAARCDRLADAVRETLADAIRAGGSSIRDYVHADGGSGCFQVECAVYERHGEPCRRCAGNVRQIRQGGRSTYYCPGCQH